jgi:phosphate transport system substrate-binding protein
VLFLGVLVLFAGAACFESASAPPGPPDAGKNDRAQLTGAGATLPAVVYQQWFYDYHHKVAPGVSINYQSIGSGAGIEQFVAGVTDFGATDAPMTDADLARAPDTQHLPTVLGAVVMSYNLPGLTEPLRLDRATAAGIFLGLITRWDDSRIAAANAGTPLPPLAITTVHRSDSSGTTFVFTDWLTKASPEWKAKVGASKAPNWPSGIGGQGNEGVTQVVSQTPGAIGYLEFSYAVQKQLQFADVQAHDGSFVRASLDSVAAAAASVQMPADYRVSITDAPGAGAYPISTFTFVLVKRDSDQCAPIRAFLRALWWAQHDPGAVASTRELGFVPLPPAVQAKVDATVHELTCGNGQPVFTPPS